MYYYYSPKVGMSYVSSTTNGFRFMETDACGAQASSDNVRSSGLEPFERWQDRNDQAGASSGGTTLLRECKQSSIDRRQRIFIEGLNFAKYAGAPVTVTLQGKTCDCDTRLDGTSAPCKTASGLCVSKTKEGVCPTTTDEDCSIATLDQTAVTLTVESHGERRIVVPVVPGYGRYHALTVTIGKSIADSVILRYHRPTITGWMSEGSLTGESNILKPDGTSRLCYLGHNFGQGPADVMETMIEIRIGSEYDIDGNPSKDLDITMVGFFYFIFQKVF